MSIDYKLFFQICDRIKYPVAASIMGNVLLMTGFLLVGPAPFLSSLVPTTGLIQGSGAILGTGYGLIVVSTFGRSHRAAMRHGFNDDLDTYMFISSKYNIDLCNPDSSKNLLASKCFSMA